MSIQKFQIYTQAISNPRNPDAGSGGQPLAGDISYQLVVNPSNISTLANNFRQLVLRGLLYVPDLRPDSPCINSTAQYIPANVTRLSDFPPSPTSQIPGVAIAPWTDSTCALAYLNAVRTSTQLVAAMVFYLPDGSTAQPPGPNDPVWNLNGNTNWQGQLVFPVYALPGLIGSTLMAQSALYSGNVTDVPNGAQLAQQYGVFDYIRLVVLIQAGENTTILPSLWVFLLIVLGVLLGVIGVTSLIMHLIQRHRRSSLRRRITNGEVDLEVLGIKRLTVPQEVLDRMPLYKYGSESSQTIAVSGAVRTHRSKTSNVSSQNENASRYRPDALAQPMCAICLDDFVVASTEGETVTEATMVRELPCRHIYHPECVDTFLRENSSLCPTCKTSALPVGYCPNIITNAMITRERRARRDAAAARAGVSQGSAQPPRFAFMSRLRPSNPAQPPAPQDTELGSLSANNTSAEPAAVPAPVAALPLSAPNRREWARQRAVAMVGGRTVVEGETDGQTRSGGVGRFFGRIFPTGRAT